VAFLHGRRGRRRRELTRAVEYPVNLPSGLNWRVTALAAAALAALELVLLVVLAIAAFGLPFAEEQKAKAQAAIGQSGDGGSVRAQADEPGTPATIQPRSETSVIVLNGNGIPGAADVASVDVRKNRYVLTGAANAPRSDFPRSIVMYRRGFEGEANRLAKDVGVKRVAPLDGLRASDLMGAQLALIVGRK
jgi:hypothetical protein